MWPIWNLLNPRAPDEVFHPDNLPTQIAEAGAARRYVNAADADTDAARAELDRERRKLRQLESAALMVAADRLAFHHTLAYIEQRWRAGADLRQTMKEAEKRRGAEFNRIMADPNACAMIQRALVELPKDTREGRRVLVDGRPVSRG